MPTWGEILKELQGLKNQPTPPGTSILDVVRRKYLGRLNAHTGRNVVVYATSWTKPGSAEPGLVSITPEDIQGFMEVLHGLPGTSLDLILHSPGGSAEAAEALVIYLRTRVTDLRVFVPHAAMSAATMLACAANRIVMGKHSFLGPIDPQIILSTEFGRSFSPAHAILEQFAQAQKECKDPSLLSSWLPILRQYGPSLIVQCKLAQKLSRSLVTEWLATYMFGGQRNARAQARRTAAALADHAKFKSHGRFLSRDQAKAMNLVVDDLEHDQVLQDLVLSVFHAFNHTFNATAAVKIIENHTGKAFVKTVQTMMIQQPMLIPSPPGAPPAPSGPPAAPQAPLPSSPSP